MSVKIKNKMLIIGFRLVIAVLHYLVLWVK